jgi:hypothetical protein
MTLNSPHDDFEKNTLAAVPGTLGKLQYLAGLRQGNGDYFHWGMARSHGEAVSSLAMAHAHTDLFLSLLRMPISSLWNEAQVLAAQLSVDVHEFVNQLRDRGDMLVPREVRGGSPRHFNSVLLALCLLAGQSARKAGRNA